VLHFLVLAIFRNLHFVFARYFIRVCSRATLLQSIVLAGGSTLLRGFGDRLLSELKRVRMLHCENACEDITDGTQAAPQGTKLRITASPERQCAARRDATLFFPPFLRYASPTRRAHRYTTWIGGSILSSLSTFSTMWVTAQEYAADPHVIFKKFS
jgi:centractin